MTIDPSVSAPNSAQPRMRDALIQNVDVTIETFLGRTRVTVADLNALLVGSVVKLDATLNQPVELRVNGVTIAQGELVAVGDKFGVRITSVVP
jgi:flagellar motor switch protein FliN/FliY